MDARSRVTRPPVYSGPNPSYCPISWPLANHHLVTDSAGNVTALHTGMSAMTHRARTPEPSDTRVLPPTSQGIPAAPPPEHPVSFPTCAKWHHHVRLPLPVALLSPLHTSPLLLPRPPYRPLPLPPSQPLLPPPSAPCPLPTRPPPTAATILTCVPSPAAVLLPLRLLLSLVWVQLLVLLLLLLLLPAVLLSARAQQHPCVLQGP